MNDDDLMPYGKYKGMKMSEVPASYLLWLIDNDKCSGDVREYIVDVYDALKTEVKNNLE